MEQLAVNLIAIVCLAGIVTLFIQRKLYHAAGASPPSGRGPRGRRASRRAEPAGARKAEGEDGTAGGD